MTDKESELHTEITQISGILIQAQESLRIVEYLSTPKSDDIDFNRAINSSFMRYTADKYWKILVIELVKLLSNSKSQDYRIPIFISKFESNGIFGDFNVSDNKIAEWKLMISSKSNEITNLSDQRDKLYAHTDRNISDSHFNKLKFEDVKELIQFLQDVLKSIYKEVFHSNYLIETQQGDIFDNLKFTISLIQNHNRKIRIELQENL